MISLWSLVSHDVKVQCFIDSQIMVRFILWTCQVSEWDRCDRTWVFLKHTSLDILALTIRTADTITWLASEGLRGWTFKVDKFLIWSLHTDCFRMKLLNGFYSSSMNCNKWCFTCFISCELISCLIETSRVTSRPDPVYQRRIVWCTFVIIKSFNVNNWMHFPVFSNML